jgi:predicted Zn-dependent protease
MVVIIQGNNTCSNPLRFAAMLRSKSPGLDPKTKEAEIDIFHRRAERFYLTLVLGGLFGLILLIAAFWGGHDLYVQWQERRLIRYAMFAIEHGEDRTATLAARNVLELNPSSASAARIVAQVAEKAGDRAALEWRRKVVQLQPKSAEDRLAWARCALQFNEIRTAQRALSEVNEEGGTSADYHAVAALIAQAQHQDEKADSEWTEAVALAPNEKTYQLQLGSLRIRSRNHDQHAAGEAMLTALRDDPKQRAAATRALISNGVGGKENAARLLELARELQTYSEASFGDQILYLDFLHQAQESQFSAYLTELEKKSADNPIDLRALLAWMSQNNMNLLALDFVKSLPRERLEKWPVPLALADIDGGLNDWRALESFVRAANWGQYDFLRHAYLARALRAQDKPAAAGREWTAAVEAASGQSDRLLTLIRATSEWRLEMETEDLLWTLAKYPAKQNDALQTLYRIYRKANDTQGLYRVLLRLFESDPDNANVENNLAQVSLLLKADPNQACRLASDVYHKVPSNAAYATTYAHSLLTKGDTKGALKIMSSLSGEQLRDPAISAYYGICLAAARDQSARSFLEAGQKATLLREEKSLIDNALANLNSQRRTQ